MAWHPGSATMQPLCLSATSPGDVWLGPFLHWTGTQWVNTFSTSLYHSLGDFSFEGATPIPGSASIRATGSSPKGWMTAVHGSLPRPVQRSPGPPTDPLDRLFIRQCFLSSASVSFHPLAPHISRKTDVIMTLADAKCLSGGSAASPG